MWPLFDAVQVAARVEAAGRSHRAWFQLSCSGRRSVPANPVALQSIPKSLPDCSSHRQYRASTRSSPLGLQVPPLSMRYSPVTLLVVQTGLLFQATLLSLMLSTCFPPLQAQTNVYQPLARAEIGDWEAFSRGTISVWSRGR